MKKAIIVFILAFAAISLPRAQKLPSEPLIPDYSQSERSAIPEAFRWRFEDIYPSLDAWRADVAEFERLFPKLKGLAKDWTASPSRMAECLELREKLLLIVTKLIGYAYFQSQVQWSSAQFQNMLSEASRLQADLAAQTGRLESDVLRLDRKQVELSLEAAPRLGPFDAFLKQGLKKKSHALSEEAQQMAAQMMLFSGGPKLVSDLLRNLDMPKPEAVLPDGSRLALDGANSRKLAASPNADERKAADEARALNLKRFENTFAALLDMSVKRDLFEAKIRRFPDCLSAELFAYDVDPQVYRNLVGTVKSRLEPYHRFLRLRRRILGLRELHPYDDRLRTVAGLSFRFDFDDARRLVQEAVAPLGPEYAALTRRAFEERWFDVYGHKDKMNLGSANSLRGVHPYICLDYRGSFFDLLTVAHELGHGLNFYLSEKAQPPAASNPVWFASEVPSTFNEILVLKHLLAQPGDDRRKLGLLSEFLERLNVLLFFTARHAELQLAAHEHVEKGGTLSPEWLNAKQLELARHYMGHDKGVMAVDDYVQSDWNHPNVYFAPFQGYFYVVGAVTSLALADKVQEDREAARKYLAFLKAGSSRPIMEVLRDLGVNLGTPKPIEEALAMYDRLVDEMERLVK